MVRMGRMNLKKIERQLIAVAFNLALTFNENLYHSNDIG